MCGVVASLSFTAAASTSQELGARLEAGMQALVHRGPDGRGVWAHPNGRVGLGHTRLALVDIDGGQQPLVTRRGPLLVASVNGEFYDAGELRAELEREGHVFETRSDSELLVHLYRRHGVDCLAHLRGEFAFVLWDEAKQRLFAARDRFGVKPLVFCRTQHGVQLASQAKALFAMGVEARWSTQGLRQALTQQYLSQAHTLFAGVESLRPGEYLLVPADGAVHRARYWDLDHPTHEAVDDHAELSEAKRAALADELRERLGQATRLRLRGDVPVAYALSGGLDSASVLALGARARVHQGPAHAFCLSFHHADYDEAALARQSARAQGAELHEVVVQPGDVLDVLDDAVYFAEGLTINGQLSAKLRLHRAVRAAGFKVLLTGEGSDEMLMGYAHLRRDWLQAQVGIAAAAGHAALPGNEVSAGLMLDDAQASPSSLLQAVERSLGFVPAFMRAKEQMTRPLRACVAAELGAGDSQLYAELLDNDTLAQLQGRAHFRQSAYLWTRHTLAGYILHTLGDGAEMAAGVEGRPPFLDHKLFEWCRTLPASVLHRDTHDKALLRQAMSQLVPQPILERQKHPFLVPPLCAFGDPRSHERVQDLLRGPVAALGFVHPDAVRKLADAIVASEGPAQARRLDPSVMLLLSAEAMSRRLQLSSPA